MNIYKITIINGPHGKSGCLNYTRPENPGEGCLLYVGCRPAYFTEDALHKKKVEEYLSYSKYQITKCDYDEVKKNNKYIRLARGYMFK